MRWYKMKAFELSNHIDSNKVFILNSSELERRLDVDYYKPSIRKLEKIIRKQSANKLGNYAIKMASGATPSVTEEEKYYTTKEQGVPFLRVQNLTTSGQLELTNVRYINYETHEKYLKRSQVEEGDLLVKITGVGRMAIASVAPKSFIGNTNQHMVVIKTGDKFLSEYLANYLNLDSVEKLASRRSTGGTRPALDYPALRSIPIIEHIDFSLITKAQKEKQRKQQQAQSLLASIDDYLLKELGIILPEQDNSLEKRIFLVNSKEVSGTRLDPYYSFPFFTNMLRAIHSIRYEVIKLSDVIDCIESGSRPSGGVANIKEGILSLGGEHINNNCEVVTTNPKFISLVYHEKIIRTKTKLHDILLVKDGATTGKVALIENVEHVEQNINEHVFLIRLKKSINPYFVTYFLHTQFAQLLIKKEITGATVTGLTKPVVKNLYIPYPPIEKQQEIVNHIEQIRNQAKQLQQEAEQVLIDAKATIEKMILGEEV